MGRKKLDRVKLLVSLPKGMAAALDAAAEAKGWDRSRLIEEACAKYLAERKGGEKPPRGRSGEG